MVFKGTLQELGKAETIATDRGFWTHNMGITRYHKQSDVQEGWWRYSFIKIGDEKIRNVMVYPAWDDLLREALGQDVELSIGGKLSNPNKRHTVIAMRTPEAGLVKTGAALQAVAMVISMIKAMFAALFLGAIVTLVSWLILGRIIGAVIGSSGTGALIGFGLGLLFIPAFLIKWLREMVVVNRQRSALG